MHFQKIRALIMRYATPTPPQSENVQHAAEIILRNWRIAYRELSLHLGISEGTLNVINQQLGYSKVCSLFVPDS
jgi:hypothetical protein